MPHYRQEVLNVLLAQLLQERGVVSAPETIIRAGIDQQKRMPDVIVSFQGLRTVIEAEVGSTSNAREKAIASARKRVEEGIAHIGVAIVYPASLRDANMQAATQLKNDLANASLAIAVVTEAGETDFVTGDVDYLATALNHAFEQLLREDVVARAVAALDVGINQFVNVILGKPGIVGRVADTMGIKALPQREKVSDEESE